jgi:CHAD domain-containing protein
VIEREVKLSAWPGFRLPDLDGVAKGARTRRRETVDLDATYYDTADLRLGRRGITLRHRRRGARETWTLKLPVDSTDPAILARAEIDVSGPPGEIPAELVLLVAAEVRTATLVKVARLMTVRRRTLVLDRSDQPLVEIDDDEVSVMDGGRVAARFRELEIEIAPDASDEVARRVVDRLLEAGAEPSGGLPKVARAVGPRFLHPPEAAPADLPPEPTAGDVVTHALRQGVTRLVEHHPAAVTGVDPEGVHQMRVGARRLRSDLRTFRPLVDRELTDPVRDELRWLGEVLGAVRDPDVLGEQLRDVAATALAPADAPVLDRIVGRLDARRDDAVAELHEVLGSDRYRRLLDQVVALAEQPPLRKAASDPASETVPGLVAKPWRDLRTKVDGLGDEPEDDALHDVRKVAKQVRYAAEAVAPVAGRPARKAAKGLRRVQDVLGDHQDTVVAEGWLRSVVDEEDDVDAHEAFALGLLVAGERTVRAERRAAWAERWERAAAGDRWEWLP